MTVCSLYVKALFLHMGGNMIYYKRYSGALLPQKTAKPPNWVKWTHHSEGKTHCEECLMLDGCCFSENTAPPCPHHPFCHCTLEPLDYSFVLANATAYSDYGKFDPYLTQPACKHTIKKNFSGMGIYCRRCKMAASRDRMASEGKISLWAI